MMPKPSDSGATTLGVIPRRRILYVVLSPVRGGRIIPLS